MQVELVVIVLMIAGVALTWQSGNNKFLAGAILGVILVGALAIGPTCQLGQSGN
jgi:hypothetical protein